MVAGAGGDAGERAGRARRRWWRRAPACRRRRPPSSPSAPRRDRVLDERDEVVPRLELDRLDPAPARLVGEVDADRLAAAGLRVPDDDRRAAAAGRRGRCAMHREARLPAARPGPAGRCRRRPRSGSRPTTRPSDRARDEQDPATIQRHHPGTAPADQSLPRHDSGQPRSGPGRSARAGRSAAPRPTSRTAPTTRQSKARATAARRRDIDHSLRRSGYGVRGSAPHPLRMILRRTSPMRAESERGPARAILAR